MAELELVEFQSLSPNVFEIKTDMENNGILKVKILDQLENIFGVLSLKIKTVENIFICAPTDKCSGQDCNLVKNSIELDQYKMKIDLLDSIKQDLIQQKVSLQEMLVQERNYINALETKAQNLSKDYSDSLKRSEEREKQFIKRLNCAIKENSDMQKSFYVLSCELQKKENAIFYLQEELKRLKLINSVESLEDYTKKIQEITDLYYKSEKERDALQVILKDSGEITEKILKSTSNSSSYLESNNKILLKDIKDLQEELKFYKIQHTQLKIEQESLQELLKSKTKQISSLESKVQDYQTDNINKRAQLSDLSQKFTILQEEKNAIEIEIMDLKSKSAQNPKPEKIKNEDIDLMLDKYFSSQGLDNNFIKVSSGLYFYGNRKINVSVKNENLVCRVGGGYMIIDEFIKSELSEKNNARSSSITSPLNSFRNTFTFCANHGKTKSLISHLVSPKNNPGSSLGIENPLNMKDKKKPFY